jgi:hypothetical protein
MRLYNYFTIGTADGYGQPQMPAKDAAPEGSIKMAINISSQSVQDNVNYKEAQYVGLTHANVDDTYIIEYGEERLKVLYVNSKGRMKQVFLKQI